MKVKCLETGDVFKGPHQAALWLMRVEKAVKEARGCDIRRAAERGGGAYGYGFAFAGDDEKVTTVVRRKNCEFSALCWDCLHTNYYDCSWFDNEDARPVAGCKIEDGRVTACPNFKEESK